MAIDDTVRNSRRPATENTIINDEPAEDIVSVNDRGRRQGGRAAPFVMMGAIALVVLIGGLATVNIIRAKLSAPTSPPAAQSAASTGLARTFNSEVPPPLPGSSTDPSSAPAPGAVCSDGSRGNELRSQDRVVVRNGAGQSVRVCPNGQVVGVKQVQPAAQPIPVVSSGPRRKGEPSPDPRYVLRPSEGPMMLNDGKYGGAPLWADIDNPQGVIGALQAAATTAQPRTEGLLTGPAAGSLEAQLTPSTTPLVQAARIGDLNMLLPKGRTIECGMSMRIISSLAGPASCVVTQNVYSANGKVLLIERGSEAVGEYRSGVSIGQKRLFVLWNRIITPAGVVINLNSPGADELGSTGLTGKVDNHWFERIGSAFLLSTIQDAIQYKISEQQASSGGATVVLGNTAQTSKAMAERVLEATINIVPTIYKNQGDRAVIYVARDLDFSNVYKLRAQP